MLARLFEARIMRISWRARAGVDQRGDGFGLVGRGGAGACDDVDRVAELLEHGIVRDGTDLPQVHLAVGGKVRLAPRLARAGFVEQAEPEGGDRAGIAARDEEIALDPADAAVEIEAEVGAGVEGIVLRRRRRTLDLGNTGQRGEREFGGAEGEEAVAALEADLGFERDAGGGEARAGPTAHRIGQPVGDA